MMKKMRYVLGMFLGSLVGFGFLAVGEGPSSKPSSFEQSRPNSSEASKTVLLNSQRIMENSLAFKKAMEEMELKRRNIEKDFEKTQTNLEKESNALVALRSTLPENKFLEKKKSFDQKVINLQNSAQERRRELEMMYQAFVSKLHQAVQKVLKELSKKHHFSIVIEQQMVLWNAPEVLEVTDEVVQELNNTLQTLSLS
jgi:Skp family chaperone for outer membrane proteins